MVSAFSTGVGFSATAVFAAGALFVEVFAAGVLGAGFLVVVVVFTVGAFAFVDLGAGALVAGFFAAGTFAAGFLGAGAFAAGFFAAGVFMAGFFAAGVFAAGAFTFDAFAAGVFAAGLFADGVFAAGALAFAADFTADFEEAFVAGFGFLVVGVFDLPEVTGFALADAAFLVLGLTALAIVQLLSRTQYIFLANDFSAPFYRLLSHTLARTPGNQTPIIKLEPHFVTLSSNQSRC